MIRNLSAIGGVGEFQSDLQSEMYNYGNVAIQVDVGDPKRKQVSYKEAEYELAVSKLHGQYAQISEEDWKELKRISDTYGL